MKEGTRARLIQLKCAKGNETLENVHEKPGEIRIKENLCKDEA